MRISAFRLLLLTLLPSVPHGVEGQSIFSYDIHPYTWLIDTRAEALGRANMALPGDLRALSTNPAGLVEMEGVEVYYRQASPYYFFETSTFTHAALGCRLLERLAIGFRYDQDMASSDALEFGQPIGGPTERANPQGVFGMASAYKISPGLTLGASLAGLHPSDDRIATPHLDLSVTKTWHVARTKGVRKTFRAAAGLENLLSASVDRRLEFIRGYAIRERYDLPVMARVGTSARWAFHQGWVHDSLPSLAFTLQAQFDDDLLSTLHSALRAGLELEVLGLVVARVGWYTMAIDDQNWPQTQRDQLTDITYGLGMRLPLRSLLGAKCPITASFDYCSLRQPSFRLDDLNPHTGEPWENFQSWSVRLAYGIGAVVKRKPTAPSATGP